MIERSHRLEQLKATRRHSRRRQYLFFARYLDGLLDRGNIATEFAAAASAVGISGAA
jgi:hypothetical protein